MNHKFNIGDKIRFINNIGGGIFKESLFIPRNQILRIDDIRHENGVWSYGFRNSILEKINSKNKRIINKIFLNCEALRFYNPISYFDVKDIENNCVKEDEYKIGDRINFCEHFLLNQSSIEWGYTKIEHDTLATITKVNEFMYTVAFFDGKNGKVVTELPKDFVEFYSHKMDDNIFLSDQETSNQDVKFHLSKFDVGDIISLEKWDLNIHTKDSKITAHLVFEDKVEIVDYNDDNYIVALSSEDNDIEFEINIKDCERCFKKVPDEDTEEIKEKENKIQEISNECINVLSKCIEALQKIK